MAETKHTPGPWFVGVGSPIPIVTDDDGDTIIARVTGAASNVLSQGDARLIAAAPDLLDVVKTLVDGGWIKGESGLASVARAAIAKAEGRQP